MSAILLPVLFAALAQFPALAAVRGSGKIVSETRNVSQFDRVSVSGSGHLSIVQGDDEGLTIETDDNLLPLIKSEVIGGRLRIWPEKGNLRPSKPIHYVLRLKSLNELSLSGSLEAEAPSLHSGQLRFEISGSGKIHVPKIEADGVDLQISGSGDVELAGKTARQNISISGAGDYRAGDFESADVTIHVSGSGDAKVWASQTLEAHVSGSGDIAYYGSPSISSHVSGSGDIHSLGKK